MEVGQLADLIQIRRDMAAIWTAVNPVLAQGEVGIALDLEPPRMKVGDGTTAWNDLEYFAGLTGAEGKSAYEVWIDAGNTGTEEDFLLSLKGAIGEQGPKGDAGDVGPQGPMGVKGDPGDPGITPEEIAVIQREITDLNTYKAPLANPAFTGLVNINGYGSDQAVVVSKNANIPVKSSSTNFIRCIGQDGLALVSMLETYGQFSNFAYSRANGTALAPTATVANNLIARISAKGYGTTGFNITNSSAIELYAAEDFRDAANGGYIVLKTTGNGTSSLVERMKIDQNGNIGIGVASPSWKLDVGSGWVNSVDGYKTNGADYGEMFESIDGQVIPYGTSVVLVGEKIRPAQDGETPFGVISATCAWVGDNGGNEWPKKYLRDEYGVMLYEDYQEEIMQATEEVDEQGNPVMVGTGEYVTKQRPVINHDYDETQEYVLRENRPEWCVVGLIGKVRIAKGQPTAANWIKMRDISETVEEWLIK